ncbi:Endonuclease III [Pseudoloma neurophilia]|uniref:Endonuclease III n=1 Tax=Pseudoloma neurophilia TaxID=146866 RepID=A0A0R0LZ84_9MICR|nr:Endonuclease III [Pseudoloma neurophilia]
MSFKKIEEKRKPHPMKKIFQIIRNERILIKAPVDTMGCTCIPETSDLEEKKFRILMMLMLSPQTKDERTYETVHNLNDLLIECTKSGISKKNIADQPLSFLEDNIRKVNFFKTKAKNIHNIATEYVNRPLPSEHSELVKLPGIGNKIAFLYLQHACNKILGVSVDTHMHRIINRIGTIKTKNPEQTRRYLESIFEEKDWMALNKVLVGYGQVICTPKKPNCKDCKVSNDCAYFKSLKF